MPIDASAYVAPTARVHPDAVIGPQCHIGEFCVIEQNVTLGRGNRLEPYVYVKPWTRLGDENELSAGAVLGTAPFDKAFDGRRSFLEIGHRNKIREHWTISRGTKPDSVTRIGDDNFIMGSGHIAHDCQVGNSCVIASNTLIAGYVTVGDQAFLSGGVVVHQFSRIGRNVMVGGNSRVNLDLAPYCLYHGFDARPAGLNLVGLRRAGLSTEEIRTLKRAYRILFQDGFVLDAALRELELLGSPHATDLAEFARSSRRGLARP